MRLESFKVWFLRYRAWHLSLFFCPSDIPVQKTKISNSKMKWFNRIYFYTYHVFCYLAFFFMSLFYCRSFLPGHQTLMCSFRSTAVCRSRREEADRKPDPDHNASSASHGHIRWNGRQNKSNNSISTGRWMDVHFLCNMKYTAKEKAASVDF